MELRFHPAALDELRKSADFYKLRSPQASQRFALAIEQALNAIQADPNRFGRLSGNDRACRVDRFPFQIIYRISGSILFVVAVAHASRRPGYWKRRK